MKQSLTCGLILLACVSASTSVTAQGIPSGSTKVAGPPDSAFNSFLAFLKTQGAAVIRTDSAQRRVEAKVKGSEESIVFVFTAMGDSTAIGAQGTKGGMAALIFGLGTVDDWLEDRRTHTAPVTKP